MGTKSWLVTLCAALCVNLAVAQAPTNPNLNAQFLVAGRNGDLASVTQALKRGAAVDSRNRAGRTVLFMAADKGQIELAELVLQAHADVNLATVEQVTPLMAASYGGHAALVRRLLDAGAATDVLDRRGKPAIIYAAGQGHMAVVQTLLDKGVQVDGAYANQLTALMWAAGQGSADTVKLLVARGANVHLRDDRGLSAADMARQAGFPAVLALLGTD